jgi:hypothetical protein
VHPVTGGGGGVTTTGWVIVIELEADDERLVPFAFVAVTVNV